MINKKKNAHFNFIEGPQQHPSARTNGADDCCTNIFIIIVPLFPADVFFQNSARGSGWKDGSVAGKKKKKTY